jgi:transcriptional regulator with XRE-family HTH domain
MKNLRKRRDAKGWSRYTLARKANVNPETIEAIETRGTKTSVVNAVALAQALGTTVEDLMGDPEKASA